MSFSEGETYHGYNMGNLEKYTIKCKDCPCKVKVFKVNPFNLIHPPKTENHGRYYYSCKETNQNTPCSYFRWFEHKWPKVKHEYQNSNTLISSQSNSSGIIDNEMSVLAGQMDLINISEISTEEKTQIVNLVLKLESTIQSSMIPTSKKNEYINYLSNLKEIF